MKRDVLFLWIPKNAGSSIEWSLGLRRFPEHINLRDFRNRGQVTFCHMPVDLLVSGGYINLDFLRSAYKFTFIRNPFDRAVSLFEYSKKIGLVDRDTSFLSVLKQVKNGIAPPGLYRSKGLSQWNPQSRFMGSIPFDFIGRFERIHDDFADLCQVLGVGPRDLAHRNETEWEFSHYTQYYTEESRTLVEEIYSEDLIRFDYNFINL
jgi:hypothetical protein